MGRVGTAGKKCRRGFQESSLDASHVKSMSLTPEHHFEAVQWWPFPLKRQEDSGRGGIL
jgi:hypothetical protein